MKEPIPLQIMGDCWNNPTEFQDQINQHPLGESLELDLRNEAPCLEKLGITDVLNTWAKNRQVSPEQVHLYRWTNPVEYVPYTRIRPTPKDQISLFFYMIRDFWQTQEPSLEQQLQYQYLFGLFIGRISISRSVILYQKNLDNLSDWLSSTQQDEMFTWYGKDVIPSVDSKSVRDQFVTPISYIDTNTSLLQHYHKFAVEIVCETYTQGDTFFPTEKTTRPIMAAKPMIVFGPRYFLARLRSLGFQTYHDIWDESYDLYQGPERWHLMQQIMRTLSDLSPADQQQILTNAHEIAIFNRKRLDDLSSYRVHLKDHDYKKFQ